MVSEKTARQYGEQLNRSLRLQTSPIAVKMLTSEADIPKEAIRPKRDQGKHYAQCQAFSLSRRDRFTVAMLKEDNWCIGPVMAYGLVPPAEDPEMRKKIEYACFEYGQYIGILTAPLESATFEPDLVLIYCDTNQLRQILLAIPEDERPGVKTNMFPISCAFSVTNAMLNNEYWVNLPDPGEYVRALTQAGEMIFSIPGAKLVTYMDQLSQYFETSMFADEQMMMRADFPQPDIYKQLFKAWNMDHG